MGTTAAILGASGYAGGELIRLVLGHPSLELGPLVAGVLGRPRRHRLHPQFPTLAGQTLLCVEEFLADGTTAVPDVVFLALPHGESGRIAAALPESTTVLDLGADHRLTVGRRLGRGLRRRLRRRLALRVCRSCPGTRERSRGARRVAVPGCYPTATILGAGAAGRGGAGRARRPRRRRVQRHLGCRPLRQGPPARQRGDGRPVGLQGRRAPAPLRDGAGARRRQAVRSPRCSPRCRAASSPPAPPALRPGVDEPSSARRDGPRLRRRDLRPPAAAGALAAHRRHLRQQLLPAPGDRGRGRRPGGRRQRDRQPGKGAAGQAVQCANLTLGLPEDTGLSVHGTAPMTGVGVTAAGRLPGRRRRRGAEGERLAGPGARRQRRPGVRRGGRLHPQPGAGRAGPLDPAGRSPTASCAPSSSTPAARTPAPARRASPTPTPPPSTSPSCSAAARPRSASARTGLIGDLPADGQAAARHRRRRERAHRRRRRRRGRGDPHDRQRCRRPPRATASGVTVGGMAKGAGMLAPGARDDALRR